MSDTGISSAQSLGIERVAHRFRVQAVVARGGMGTIYRALDEQTGRTVALKLLRATASPEATQRFLREGGLLATVQHHGIVGYVAHGIEEGGIPYLVMEWLEGEDLARRLSRGSLSLEESLQLLSGVAQALTELHQRGIVHRDLKPSNLFLRQGDVEKVAILDFGLARSYSSEPSLTKTGLVLGTPEYMAPEQARGERELTAAVDVFALGCIFYECLTGCSPFRAEHLSATLVKILFEIPASPRQYNPALPLSLDRCFARILAKDPGARLPDAAALVQEIERVREDRSDPESDSGPVLGCVSTNEQGLLCLLLLSWLPASSLDGSSGRHADAPTAERRDALLSRMVSLGGHAQTLADGSIVARLEAHDGVITDLAIRAAHYALTIQAEAPDVRIALGLGCADQQPNRVQGELLNRIDRMLQLHSQEFRSQDILLDAVTAGLLDASFQIEPGRGGCYRLHGRRIVDASRPLLGRPTPCVGRDFELSSLELELSQCTEESVSRAVVLLGPPGIGKTRLRHEFLRRARERMTSQGLPTDFLVARADAQTMQSPYALVVAALQHFCGVAESQPAGVRHTLLTQRLGRNLRAHTGRMDPSRALAVLVELCESPGQIRPLSQLRQTMDEEREQEAIRTAFCQLLLAESKHHPVLLVVDDLQWADSQSVKLIGEALQGLMNAPLLVMAYGRLEVRERFPYLWEGRQEIQVRGLTRRASERLIREILGSLVPSEVVATLVDQAAGNVLFLEELVRAHAVGEQAGAADTVLAMLQARLSRLPAEARRALRAASVFGMSFWMGGVNQVLGRVYSEAALAQYLRCLVDNELCEERTVSRFPEEKEYGFRHALVREAAYGLLTEEDRICGHRLAGYFLLQAGERNPQILLDHFTRGEDHKNSVLQLLCAGDQALRLCSRQEARQHYAQAAERAARMVEGATQRELKAEALLRLVQSALDVDTATANLERLHLVEVALDSEGATAQEPCTEEHEERTARMHYLRGRIFLYSGDTRAAMREYAIVLPIAQRLRRPQLIAQPACLHAYALFNQGNFQAAIPLLCEAMGAFDQLKAPMESLLMQSGYAVCLMGCGQTRAAEAEFEAIEQYARSNQLPAALAVAQISTLGKFLMRGDFASALREGPAALETALRIGDWMLVYFGCLIMGQAATHVRDFTTAHTCFGRAEALVQQAGGQIIMNDRLELAQAELLLAEGRIEEAIEHAGELCGKARAGGLLLTLGGAERCCAQALAKLAPHRLPEIERHIRRSLEAYEHGGLVVERARTQLCWALILKRCGERSGAQEAHDAALMCLRTSWCRAALDEAEQIWDAVEPELTAMNDQVNATAIQRPN